MAYLQQTSSNQKAVTMGAVAAIHAIAIYAVVSGLAVDLIRNPPIILETWHRPIEKKPDPPKDIPKDKTTLKDTVQPDVPDSPIPPVGGNPLVPFDIGPTGGEPGAGGGDVGVVEFPQPPISEPTPRFTAKAPKPRGNSANWVRQIDYPTGSIRMEHQGLTRVKLEVSALGRVTQCIVTGSSGHPELDAATCDRLTNRARFEPATDTSGQTTAGTFSTSVRWQLPE